MVATARQSLILTVAIVFCSPLFVTSGVRGQDAPAAAPATAPAAATPAAPATAPAAPATPVTPADAAAATQPATPATPTTPAAEATTPTGEPVKSALEQSADDFWHFASIARYAEAKAEGEKLLPQGEADPAKFLDAFEKVVEWRNRHVPTALRLELYDRMLVWARVAELKDITPKFLATFNKAKKARAYDPVFIESQVERLARGTRPYQLAMEQLRESGEMAIPVMLRFLKDPAQGTRSPHPHGHARPGLSLAQSPAGSDGDEGLGHAALGDFGAGRPGL